ncbi:hypothetical protein [Myxococcus xanthus]|nr:hypothetical protein [Myxococcus xanthus]
MKTINNVLTARSMMLHGAMEQEVIPQAPHVQLFRTWTWPSCAHSAELA